MSPADYIWFYGLAFLAEVLGTLGGFGSSVFFVPLAGLFFDPFSVLGLTAWFHVMSNGVKLYFFKEAFRIDIIIWMGIPALLGVIPGAFMASWLQSDWFILGQGILLMGMSIFIAFSPIHEQWKTQGGMVCAGIISGFLAGWLGTGGALRGLALSAFGLHPSVFIFTSAAIDTGVDVSRAFIYTIKGFVHAHDAWLLPGLFIASSIGTWLGKKILSKMKPIWFQRSVLILIFLIGCYLVINWVFKT